MTFVNGSDGGHVFTAASLHAVAYKVHNKANCPASL